MYKADTKRGGYENVQDGRPIFGTAIKESTTCVVNEKRSVIVTVDICLETNDENKTKIVSSVREHNIFIYMVRIYNIRVRIFF